MGHHGPAFERPPYNMVSLKKWFLTRGIFMRYTIHNSNLTSAIKNEVCSLALQGKAWRQPTIPLSRPLMTKLEVQTSNSINDFLSEDQFLCNKSHYIKTNLKAQIFPEMDK